MAGIVLFKPVNVNDVGVHDFILVGYSYITEEVTDRLQERKKMKGRHGEREYGEKVNEGGTETPGNGEKTAKTISPFPLYGFVNLFGLGRGINPEDRLEDLPAAVVDRNGFGPAVPAKIRSHEALI